MTTVVTEDCGDVHSLLWDCCKKRWQQDTRILFGELELNREGFVTGILGWSPACRCIVSQLVVVISQPLHFGTDQHSLKSW